MMKASRCVAHECSLREHLCFFLLLLTLAGLLTVDNYFSLIHRAASTRIWPYQLWLVDYIMFASLSLKSVWLEIYNKV